MNYEDLIRREVLSQPVYEPGRPVEDVAREFGLNPADILKLASNENPLGPSPLGLAAASQAVRQVHFYPDGGSYYLREKLASQLALKPEQFIVSNGSNEIMSLLCQAFLRPGQEAVMGAHAFIAFKLGVLMAGATPVEVPMPELRHDLSALLGFITPQTRLVYLPNPNNPTGDFTPERAVLEFVRSLPDHVVLLYDEAYAEYLERAPDLRPLLEEGRKILITRTFSKIYGLAGLRIGYGYGAPELIGLLNRLRNPFNVNTVAQAAALAALDDEMFVQRSRQMNDEGLAQLARGFDELGLTYWPSSGNFMLVEVAEPAAAFEALQRRGIIVRPVAGYGLKTHLRVSVGTAAQNDHLLNTLDHMLEGATAEVLRKPS